MDASLEKFATNAESSSVRFGSRGTANRKCTALVNVGVMVKGLRPTGGDGRENTRLTANAEQQRRDSSGFIGRHSNVEKTVRIQSETKNLQTQKVPLSYHPLTRILRSEMVPSEMLRTGGDNNRLMKQTLRGSL